MLHIDIRIKRSGINQDSIDFARSDECEIPPNQVQIYIDNIMNARDLVGMDSLIQN